LISPVKALLQGQTAIVTGSNQGLGLEIARQYIAHGARVAMCARDPRLLGLAADGLRASSSQDANILAIVADVSRPDHVARIVATAIDAFGTIDILVNNAGITGPSGATEEVSWDEWMRTIEINLIGSVLMCREVIPHLKKQGHGKIVQLSGGGATSPLPLRSAYGTSKAAVVRFAETLAHELASDGIDVNAIAPGALNTRMLDDVLNAGPEKVGKSYFEKALEQRRSGGGSISGAAELAVFLGSSASNGITGRLISAIWDDWPNLPPRKRQLAETDVYTLRRIVPGDRGLDWK